MFASLVWSTGMANVTFFCHDPVQEDEGRDRPPGGCAMHI
jgi:hypothetical protein